MINSSVTRFKIWQDPKLEAAERKQTDVEFTADFCPE